jgi:hypothetical protein
MEVNWVKSLRRVNITPTIATKVAQAIRNIRQQPVLHLCFGQAADSEPARYKQIQCRDAYLIELTDLRVAMQIVVNALFQRLGGRQRGGVHGYDHLRNP